MTSGELRAQRETLLVGGIALLPTDTVYGLAAALDSPAGVDALYRLKGRSRSQPCQVLVLGERLLDEVTSELDPAVSRAVHALCPGPVTCIVADAANRFRAVAGEQTGTVGLRAPRVSGPLARLGLLLAATSANAPGGPDPATLDAVPVALRAGVDAEVDAGRLPGTASAVVNLRPVAVGAPAELLRPGPDPAAVAAALERVGVRLL